jgi:hypothetical protein
MTRIKVVRPYDRGIDEALEKGYANIPALPDGFYLAKKRQELEDAMVVERMRQNEFRITRTEDVLTKVFEGERYSLYEKKLKKWHELV